MGSKYKTIRKLMGKEDKNLLMPDDELSFEDLKKKVPKKYFEDNKNKPSEELIVENFLLYTENMNLLREVEILKQKIDG